MRAGLLVGAALLASTSVADAGGVGGRASVHAAALAGSGRGVHVTRLSGGGGAYNGFVAGGGYPADRRFNDRAYGRRGFGGPALGLYGQGPFDDYGYEGSDTGDDLRDFASVIYSYGDGDGYAPASPYKGGGYRVSGEGAYTHGYAGYALTPALPEELGRAPANGIAYSTREIYRLPFVAPCGC